MVFSSKKILIVCKGFYPEQTPRANRSTELAKEFCRNGHEVTVLTCSRDYDYREFLKKYPITIKSFGETRLKPLTRSKYKVIGDLPRKFGRLLFMLFDYPDIEIIWLLKKALKKEINYDLMISIAVPYSIHWGVAAAVNNSNFISKIWVADCGDPFMGNKLESFRYPFYFSYLEKWLFKKVDYISIPAESARDGYYKEFQNKIKIIPQGFNFNEVIISNEIKKDSEKISFAYAGGVAASGVRSLNKIIEYLMTVEKDFEFHIYPANYESALNSLIEYSNGKIVLHNTMPRLELIAELSKMDFLLNLLIDNNPTKQAPSKLIDYGFARRPILSLNPLAPDVNLLNEFLQKEYQNQHIINDFERFNIENVSMKFLDLLDREERGTERCLED